MRERRDISYRSLILGAPDAPGDDASSAGGCGGAAAATPPQPPPPPSSRGVSSSSSAATVTTGAANKPNGVSPLAQRMHVFRSLSAAVLFEERVDEDGVVVVGSGSEAEDTAFEPAVIAVSMTPGPSRSHRGGGAGGGGAGAVAGMKAPTESLGSLASIAQPLSEDKIRPERPAMLIRRTTSEIFQYWSPLLLNFGPAPKRDKSEDAPKAAEGMITDGETPEGLDVTPSDAGGETQEGTERTHRLISISKAPSEITFAWDNINVHTKPESQTLCVDFEEVWDHKVLSFYQGEALLVCPVSGVVRPGELLAIMGASGAGKTTLLNSLTFRNLRKLDVTGNVYANGYPVNAGHLTAISAYVQQEDLFIGTLTVREVLKFQSKLRVRHPEMMLIDERDWTEIT
ncbi:unnamed protein product [Notodromas monacha]|uniref:ABC transporter domain-containing protein n=1 Tax=Notodromas monacha TaxID=399045 RepID=A0A7R9GIH9_9CRUS|nr:unnamed protein product [Notodromas monacha]CAG0922473.1 unnamed protein product [Notodromas monacha]